MAHVLETSSLETMLIPHRLKAAGIRAYIPTYSREVHHARRVEQRSYSLYGRYIFAWFGVGQLRSVLKTRGVVGVLRRAGSDTPASVDDRLIECIADCVKAPEFSVGEKVEIVAGRWQGLNGLFSRMEDERVMILLSMLGRDIEMPFESFVVRKSCTRNGYAEV